MRVLVTGDTGFIGRRLVRSLLLRPGVDYLAGVSRSKTNSFEYAHFCLDLRSGDDVQYVMREAKPDVIFHLAGHALIKPDKDCPFEVTEANVYATHKLLEYCPQGCRFVLASSAAVYGNGGAQQVCDVHSPLKPNSPYGASKLAAEALLNAYAEMGKVTGVSLRLVANVGPEATHGLLRDLVHKVCKEPALKLYGDRPGSRKPYVHVRDTVKALLLVASRDFGRPHTVFNVSNDDTLTVEEIAHWVIHFAGISKEIEWDPAANWLTDNPVVRVDGSRLRAQGWVPAYPSSTQAVTAAIQEMI